MVLGFTDGLHRINYYIFQFYHSLDKSAGTIQKEWSLALSHLFLKIINSLILVVLSLSLLGLSLIVEHGGYSSL